MLLNLLQLLFGLFDFLGLLLRQLFGYGCFVIRLIEEVVDGAFTLLRSELGLEHLDFLQVFDLALLKHFALFLPSLKLVL